VDGILEVLRVEVWRFPEVRGRRCLEALGVLEYRATGIGVAATVQVTSSMCRN
jgi:hypothetical protein